MLVMWENPNSTDEVHHPARLLFDALERKFCSKPRNKNSSGQAVKNRIPMDNPKNALQRLHSGANTMKRISSPRGIAMQANRRKLPKTYNPQFLPQPMEYPIPLVRRTKTSAASAIPIDTRTV